MNNETPVIESAYTVTITNEVKGIGEERVLTRREVEAALRSVIRQMGVDMSGVVVKVESH